MTDTPITTVAGTQASIDASERRPSLSTPIPNKDAEEKLIGALPEFIWAWKSDKHELTGWTRVSLGRDVCVYEDAVTHKYIRADLVDRHAPDAGAKAQEALDDIFGPTIKGDFTVVEKQIMLADRIARHADTIKAALEAARGKT